MVQQCRVAFRLPHGTSPNILIAFMKEDSAPPDLGSPPPAVLHAFTRLGHLMMLTTFVTWIAMYLIKGDPYDETWKIILLTTFFGRAAAVGAGLNQDFHPLFLFYQAVITDFIIVLYLFPIFVRGYERLTHIRYIGNYLDSLHKVALNYKGRVAPYGVAGLLIFVVFPFWSTGPLVGSIIGFLIGLPAVLTVVVVTVGNIVATAAWVWFYDWLQDWSPGTATTLLVLIFALAIGGVLASRIRRRQKQ